MEMQKNKKTEKNVSGPFWAANGETIQKARRGGEGRAGAFPARPTAGNWGLTFPWEAGV